MSNAGTTELGPSAGNESSDERRAAVERAQLEERIGLVVGGRYKILSTLGAGGMGAVYEAVHEVIGRKVAIKCLHREFARDRETLERFRREARAATAIGNEHIIDVTDVGELPDGAPYLVMEHLTGKTLGAEMESVGPMRVSRVVHIAKQVCNALADAHEKGIVHRDLKPENVFLVRRGGDPDFVKVLDFGISKTHASDGMSELTRTGMAIGTPSYMSPEQAQGLREVDARTDIWAMGVILYEMLTQQRPFVADTYPMLLMRIVGGTPHRVAAWRRDIPDELDALIMRCLEKNVAERVATMRELELGLAAFARLESVPELSAADAGGAPAGAERSASVAKVARATPNAAAEALGNAATASSGAHERAVQAAPSASTPVAAPSPPAPSRALILGVVAALLCGTAVSVWAFGGAATPAPVSAPVAVAPIAVAPIAPPPVVRTIPDPPPVVAPPGVPAPSADVRRRIESVPAGATVEQDGRDIGTTPMELVLARGMPVEIVLRAAGRRSVTRLIGPEDPEVVSISLPAARRTLPQLAPH